MRITILLSARTGFYTRIGIDTGIGIGILEISNTGPNYTGIGIDTFKYDRY